MIKVIYTIDKELLISQIEEVEAILGEANCKLINPCHLTLQDGNRFILTPYMYEYTNQTIFMINSERIITLFDPKDEILTKYKEYTK